MHGYMEKSTFVDFLCLVSKCISVTDRLSDSEHRMINRILTRQKNRLRLSSVTFADLVLHYYTLSPGEAP
jgi:hypothetical protein